MCYLKPQKLFICRLFTHANLTLLEGHIKVNYYQSFVDMYVLEDEGVG